MNKNLWEGLKENNPQLCEANWTWYYSNKLPMSKVYRQNKLPKNIPHSFTHITPSVEKIIADSKLIGSTGGCLGPGVYCSSLSDNMTLSSLSSHILKKRVNWNIDTTENAIIINILPTKSHYRFLGVDYLMQGEQYYLLSSKFDKKLFQHTKFCVEGDLGKVVEEMNTLFEYQLDNIKISKYQKIMNNLLETSSLYSYITYETLQEFICLFQNNSLAIKAASNNEFNYWAIKDMIFEISPGLRKNFKLSNFKPTISSIAKKLVKKSKEGNFFILFNKYFFYVFFKYRFAQILRHKIYGLENELKKPLILSEMSSCKGLMGHLIHRRIKDDIAGTEKLKLYELHRQYHLIRMMNRNRIAATYNKILPINEYCINPNIKKFQIYLAQIDVKNFTIINNKKVNVSIQSPKNIQSIVNNFRSI